MHKIVHEHGASPDLPIARALDLHTPANVFGAETSPHMDIWRHSMNKKCRPVVDLGTPCSLSVFAYDSITVLSVWELISVSMRHSQGDGVNTSMSRSMCCTHASLDVSIRDSSCVVCVVIFRGMVMCYLGRK